MLGSTGADFEVARSPPVDAAHKRVLSVRLLAGQSVRWPEDSPIEHSRKAASELTRQGVRGECTMGSSDSFDVEPAAKVCT